MLDRRLDKLHLKIIEFILANGPSTERRLRGRLSGQPGLNYRPAKSRLEELVKGGLLRMERDGTKKVYSVTEPGWNRINEQMARDTGKLIPTLPLQDVKKSIGSLGSPRFKLEEVEFDLIGYYRGRIVREKVKVRPRPEPLHVAESELEKDARENAVSFSSAEYGTDIGTIVKVASRLKELNVDPRQTCVLRSRSLPSATMV